MRTSDTTGIVEIAQITPIAVVFTAPQGQLPEIAKAMKAGPVKVTALKPDGKTVLAQGELSLINNEIDAASGTIKLKATFANENNTLWPGLSVDTRLLVDTLRNVVAIPSDAVQRGPSELYAWVVGPDDKVDKRVLKVGPFTEGMAVIESGLRGGERVVTAGQYRLQEGTQVDTGRDKAPDAKPPTNEADLQRTKTN